MSTVTERFFEVLDLLGESQASLCRDIPEKVTKQSLSNARNGRNGISVEVISHICNKHENVNAYYILTGRGTPLLNKENNEQEPLKRMIPLYKVEAAAGFGVPGFSVRENDIEGYYKIKEFFRASFMLYVRGDSMVPLYNPGDVIAVRIITEPKFIQWNKPHLLSTKSQGLIIKRLKPKDDNSVLAVSENSEYDPFLVPKEDIDGIALVLGVVRVDNL